MTLEKMAQFFDARLAGYDLHMLQEIEGAQLFYPYTASLLPKEAGVDVLDLGCGTGLELENFFSLNPLAAVTGIDLAPGMLSALRHKFPQKTLKLIQGSYFDVPFGLEIFDAAVSVESLHHFTKAEKIPLYRKLCAALKPGGYFILTDYFAQDDTEEMALQNQLLQMKQEQGIVDGELYHFDTPLTVAHEREALLEAGFADVEVLEHWGATYTLRAGK
jgi:tRNA (cmo5U34)-methyltransferase